MISDFAIDIFEGERLHRELAAIRQRNPVSPALFAGQPAMLITGYQALAEAFRDNDRFPPADAYRITIEPVQGVTFQTMECWRRLNIDPLCRLKIDPGPVAAFYLGSCG